MTIDDLTVNFKHLKREQVLSDWEWLIGKNKLPVLLLASGDAFIQEAIDESVYFLDVAFGRIAKIASSGDEFSRLLSNKDFINEFFSVNMIGDLIFSGKKLERGKIYSFIVSPALGGKYEMENVEVSDIEVHFSINGQIHQQLRDNGVAH